MRFFIGLLFLLFSGLLYGEPLCPINEKIVEDMRIPEDHFSKDNAEAALKLISRIVSDGEKPNNWTVVPNSLKIIEGYVLRRAALNNESGVPEFDKSQFCLFMEKSAWWYD